MFYKVERIVARRIKRKRVESFGGLEYVLERQLLIKWLGYDEKESTWEPEENIKQDIPIMYQHWVDNYGQERVQEDQEEEA